MAQLDGRVEEQRPLSLLSSPFSLSLLVYSAGGSRKFMHTFVCCFFLTFPLFLLSSLELCDCVREHNGKMASVHATHPPSTHRVGNRRPIGWLAVRIDWLNCHFMKFVSLLRCAWKSWAREKRLQGRGVEERGVLRTEGAYSGGSGGTNEGCCYWCCCCWFVFVCVLATICSIKYIKLCAVAEAAIKLDRFMTRQQQQRHQQQVQQGAEWEGGRATWGVRAHSRAIT